MSRRKSTYIEGPMSRPLGSPEYEAAKWVRDAANAYLAASVSDDRDRAPASSLTEAAKNWLAIEDAAKAAREETGRTP